MLPTYLCPLKTTYVTIELQQLRTNTLSQFTIFHVHKEYKNDKDYGRRHNGMNGFLLSIHGYMQSTILQIPLCFVVFSCPLLYLFLFMLQCLILFLYHTPNPLFATFFIPVNDSIIKCKI